MAHIGEVLFASSSQASTSQKSTPQASGLGWTRDAVELAETTLATIAKGSEDGEEARRKCTECLEMGTANWKVMVENMLREEKARKQAPSGKVEGNGSWLWGNGSSTEETAEDVNRWEREAKMVDAKMQQMRALAMTEDERRKAQGPGMGVLRGVFG